MQAPAEAPAPAQQKEATPGSAKKSSSKTVTDTVIGEEPEPSAPLALL